MRGAGGARTVACVFWLFRANGNTNQRARWDMLQPITCEIDHLPGGTPPFHARLLSRPQPTPSRDQPAPREGRTSGLGLSPPGIAPRLLATLPPGACFAARSAESTAPIQSRDQRYLQGEAPRGGREAEAPVPRESATAGDHCMRGGSNREESTNAGPSSRMTATPAA